MFKRRDRETFKGRFTSGKKYLSAKHSTPRIFRACTSLNLTQILRLLSLSNFTQQSHEIHCLHIFFYKTWTFKHSVLCNFSFNNFFCISNRCISKRGLLRGVFFFNLVNFKTWLTLSFFTFFYLGFENSYGRLLNV